MDLKNKKGIVAAALCGFMMGNLVSLGSADAGSSFWRSLGKVVKTGGIVWTVDHYSNDINKFINSLMAKNGVSDEYATKVVPIISVGSKGYVGAAQVSGPKDKIDKCKAALTLEGNFHKDTFRIEALIPVDSKGGAKFHRVQGVGVSAKVDVKI